MTGWVEPGYLPALALLALRHYAAVLVLLLFALAVGRTLTRRLSWDSRLETFLVSAGLGLAVIGHLTLVLGLAGGLSPRTLIGAFAVLALLTGPAWKDLARSARNVFRGRPPARATAAAALLLAPLLLLPLYPSTAFDATMYHLPYARAFLSDGGLTFLPTLRFPVFPQLAEGLFALLLLGAGDAAAHCLQTVFTLSTGALLFLWGRQVFSRAAGALAAALYLGSPIVAYLSGTAYADPAFTFFSVAALHAFSRWRAAGEFAWLAVAGFFAGSAAATKYLGLFWVLFLGAAVVWMAAPGSRRRAASIFLLCALAAALPWYARIAAHTGNPVFPYLPGIFGSSAWDLGAHQPRLEDAGAVLRRWAAVALWPWDLVFRRERFASHPPWSPFYLPAVFFAALAALRDARAARYAAAALAYALFASLAPPDPRYLMPAAALLALISGSGIVRALGRLEEARGRSFVLATLLLLILLPGWLYALRHARRQGPVPVSAAGKEEYLEHFLPAYPAIRHLNRARGEEYVVYGFFAENMPYFATGRFWGDWFGPASYDRVLGAGRDAESLHRALRALGATDLLIVKSAPPVPAQSDPRFPAFFVPDYEDSAARVFALAQISARSSRTTSGPP
ncbi:MAG: glycosyltransferase family 39 protein [Thermoanaerobaculia bacterium]